MKKDNLFKFVLLTFWGCLCFSCQNEEYEETFDEESQISIREISKTEIPVGITPMAFNNRAELDEFINLNNSWCVIATAVGPEFFFLTCRFSGLKRRVPDGVLA